MIGKGWDLPTSADRVDLNRWGGRSRIENLEERLPPPLGYVPNGDLLGRIPVNPTPIGSAVTPDGRTCWVTSDAYGTVTPIDVKTGAVGTPITVGGGPYEICFTPDGLIGYVSNSATSDVTSWYPRTGVVRTLSIPLLGGVPQAVEPIGIAMSLDGKTVYVCCYGTVDGLSPLNKVVPIDVATDTPLTPIVVGNQPNCVAITPNGLKGYVTIGSASRVDQFTVATGVVGSPISVGGAPVGIAITPDGTKAYVANSADGTVTPITLATSTPGTPITVGYLPVAVVISPDGKTVYVSNSGDGTVTPIDVATNVAGAPITVGANPHFLSITPDGSMIFVPDKALNVDIGSVSRIVAAPYFALSLSSPVPAISGIGSDGSFGSSTLGSWDNLPTGYLQLFKVTAPVDFIGVRIRMYLDGNGSGSGTALLKATLFAQNVLGEASDLLAVSDETSVATGRAAGWVSFDVDFKGQENPAGVYWCGIHTGGTDQVARLSWTSIANTRKYKAIAYANGVPDPFPAPDATDDHQAAILVDYRNAL
jgi:YVTN family beta-propeller protein